MLHTLALLAVLAPQNPGDVVINEFSYDDGGTDDLEFVELYNKTANPIDISGWTVGGEDDLGPNFTFTVAPSTTIAPGGFFVMGAGTVPNVNQAITNPNDGTQTNLFENSEEGLFLLDTGGQQIDRVDYETYNGTWAPAGREGGGLPGGQSASGAHLMTYQRYTDGLDTDNNGDDFGSRPWTPGQSNNLASGLPYVGLYDGMAIGSTLPQFPGSFVDGTVIDPTQLQGPNPSIIPASPQGGNAAIFYDPTGGGNMCPLLTSPHSDVILECYVYFETAVTTGGVDAETWSIGVRGNTDAFGHHVDIDPRFVTITNRSDFKPGLTGICWVYQRTAQYTTLWLVDFNDGGNDYTVLHTEQIVAGQNDGWQRLKIRAVGTFVEANFGGTYGQNDGVHVSARTTTTRPGGVYIGYREHLVTNPEWRPITVDFLTVSGGSGGVSFTGQGVPHTQGQPLIDVAGFPFIGNQNFGYEGSGFLPNDNNGTLIFIGLFLLNPPFDLSFIGGQPGSFLYVNTLFAAVTPTDAQGDASLPLSIPLQVHLIGAPLWAQWFEVDNALPFSLPVANTNALGIVLGD